MESSQRIRLVNTQTLGAACGEFDSHEEAEAYLRDRGYSDGDFRREGSTILFAGGINS